MQIPRRKRKIFPSNEDEDNPKTKEPAQVTDSTIAAQQLSDHATPSALDISDENVKLVKEEQEHLDNQYLLDQTRKRLISLLESAEEAERAEKEFILNEIFAELTTISKQIQDGALPPDLQSQAVKAVDKVTGLRNMVRQRLQILPDILFEGDYRTALITLRTYLERGYPEKIRDEGGLLGKPSEEVEVTEFYSRVSNEYVTRLRKQATDQIEKIKEQLSADPVLAIAMLSEVLGGLEDKVLTMDQRDKLSDLITECKDQLAEAQTFA